MCDCCTPFLIHGVSVTTRCVTLSSTSACCKANRQIKSNRIRIAASSPRRCRRSNHRQKDAMSRVLLQATRSPCQWKLFNSYLSYLTPILTATESESHDRLRRSRGLQNAPQPSILFSLHAFLQDRPNKTPAGLNLFADSALRAESLQVSPDRIFLLDALCQETPVD